MRFGFFFSFFFLKAILSFFEKLMTADGGLITGAGKAYDSGRGAFCVRFVVCVFSSFRVFVVVVLLLLCCGVCCGVVVVWLLCGCCRVVVLLWCCCGVFQNLRRVWKVTGSESAGP